MQGEAQPSILVLDDDPDLLGMVRVILEREGFKVTTAEDAVKALASCEKELPQLIIADLMLPHMDGEDFLQEFWRRWPHASPPVILLSASEIREQVAERMKVEASLSKPFEIEELRKLVKSLL